MNSNHVLREAYQTGAAASGSAEHFSDNSQLYFQLGGDFPRSAMAVPIVVRGKIAGILYSDINEELSDKPDLVHILNLACKTAGMTIDLLPVRPKAAAKPAAAQAPLPHLQFKLLFRHRLQSMLHRHHLRRRQNQNRSLNLKLKLKLRK